MQFCKDFNAATQQQAGDLLPTIITYYADGTFSFVTKQPPAAVLLKKAANIASGSGEPNKEKVGKISKDKLMEVVKIKMPDLNTDDPEQAAKILAGTAMQDGPRDRRHVENQRFENCEFVSWANESTNRTD